MYTKTLAGLCALAVLVGIPGAATAQTVRDSGSGPSIQEARDARYDGPQARIAVARFENKASNSGRWWNRSIGEGMADMLTTALFQTGHFIVLERQALDDVISEQDLGASGRVRGDTAAAIGEIEGAELLVTAAVTEFSENASGRGGSLGGSRIGKVIGSIAGSTSSAHMAIDLRIIDTTTSRVLAATSVEGEAKDFDIGGALAGYTSRHSLGGSLSAWENTPREKALRDVIGKAVEEIIRRTPREYYRHGEGGETQQASSGSDGGQAAEGTGERVVVTNTLDARQGPSAESAVRFNLESGTIVEVMARAGDWIQIRNGDGETAWIASEHALEVQ
ncbi:MAG: CsgG/HfaB family protein [Wenzhouxiangella sp.]